MYVRRQQGCTLQVSILGNSRQDIEDICSKYDCSKVDLKDVYSQVGCIQLGLRQAVSMHTVNRHVIG